MTEDARKVFEYLKAKGFNSARETAQDCGLDEVDLDAAIEEIEEETAYVVAKGTRTDSYGHEVIWLR